MSLKAWGLPSLSQKITPPPRQSFQKWKAERRKGLQRSQTGKGDSSLGLRPSLLALGMLGCLGVKCSPDMLMARDFLELRCSGFPLDLLIQKCWSGAQQARICKLSRFWTHSIFEKHPWRIGTGHTEPSKVTSGSREKLTTGAIWHLLTGLFDFAMHPTPSCKYTLCARNGWMLVYSSGHPETTLPALLAFRLDSLHGPWARFCVISSWDLRHCFSQWLLLTTLN